MPRNAETDARHTDTAMHRKALACPRAFIQNQANSTHTRLPFINCAIFFEAAIWRPLCVLGRCYCVLEQSCVCLLM